MTDIRQLTLEELSGVVNVYPWFPLARKELCKRMSRLGGWSREQYAEAAMYLSDRKILSELLRTVEREDCSDEGISEVVRKFVSAPGAGDGQTAGNQDKPRVVVVGGDFFSQADYDKVRSDDDVFSLRTTPSAPETAESRENAAGLELEFCTETLAAIYAEQGYYEQAKSIYSKLILAIPEKSVYFAALIDKLGQEEN